jgi:hypothetical protein|tara:strand:+ start:979 stop:1137 length:159 start_codon:yes stop_codon:yes gene_type:complete
MFELVGYEVIKSGFLNPSAIRAEDSFTSSAKRVKGIRSQINFFIRIASIDHY